MTEKLVCTDINGAFIKSPLVCLSKGDGFELLRRSGKRHWLAGEARCTGCGRGGILFMLRGRGGGWESLSSP